MFALSILQHGGVVVYSVQRRHCTSCKMQRSPMHALQMQQVGNKTKISPKSRPLQLTGTPIN